MVETLRAHGFTLLLLLNTLVGIRMADDIDDPDARELIESVAPTKSELLVRLSRPRD